MFPLFRLGGARVLERGEEEEEEGGGVMEERWPRMYFEGSPYEI